MTTDCQHNWGPKWGQASALNSLSQEKGTDKEPAEFSHVTCSLAPSPHAHRHKNTPLHCSPLKDWGEPALLLKASNHVDTFLKHGFWSAECYLIVRKPVNRSYWFLKETFHSHTVQVTLLWCKKTIKQKKKTNTTTKQTRLSVLNIFSTYPGLPPCHCSLSSDTWVCWWRKTHISHLTVGESETQRWWRDTRKKQKFFSINLPQGNWNNCTPQEVYSLW